MKKGIFSTLVLSLALALPALAGGSGVAIVPKENIPIGTTTAEAAEAAIRQGAARRNWIPEVLSPTSVRCRLHNRSHVVVVDVEHDAGNVTVKYVSSVNMNYDPAAGTIHRNYNRWIANLVKDIQTAAAQLPVAAPAAAPAESAGSGAAAKADESGAAQESTPQETEDDEN